MVTFLKEQVKQRNQVSPQQKVLNQPLLPANVVFAPERLALPCSSLHRRSSHFGRFRFFIDTGLRNEGVEMGAYVSQGDKGRSTYRDQGAERIC